MLCTSLRWTMLVSVLGSAGCFDSSASRTLPPLATEDLPPGVKAIEADADSYRYDPDNALLDAVEGDARDDLTELTGCWGAYLDGDMAFPSRSLTIYRSFDMGQGVAENQSVIRGILYPQWLALFVPVAQEMRSWESADTTTFSILDVEPDHLMLQSVGSSGVSNFDVGDDMPAAPDYETDLTLTLDGDFLVEHTINDYTLRPMKILYRRMDCVAQD